MNTVIDQNYDHAVLKTVFLRGSTAFIVLH